MADRLHIRDIQAYGYIGVLPEERRIGQWFIIDLTIWLDLATAGKSDRLEDTYDYSAIPDQVKTLIATANFQLIEATAEAIAQLILQSEQVHQVQVHFTKPKPPIAEFNGTVAVEIIRTKHSAVLG
jgi:7,8-dihydroneopterin aldolase/epimerase/oxygenase